MLVDCYYKSIHHALIIITWDPLSLGSFTNYVDKILAFFDHLLPCVDIFGMNIDKKWTFQDRLPTSSCKRSLWTTPVKEYEYQMIIFKIFNLCFLFLLQRSTVERKRWASEKITEWLTWISRYPFIEPNPWNLWFSGKDFGCFHQLSEVKRLPIGQFNQTDFRNAKLFSFSRCW